ncbi:MAG: hypothetical protein KBA47_01195 [Caldisericia bacterium]|nr:hypothetical protein [Caldisericia bacterium]
MKRIILVLALVLLVALPVFAQEVTVEDLNKKLTALAKYSWGGAFYAVPEIDYDGTDLLFYSYRYRLRMNFSYKDGIYGVFARLQWHNADMAPTGAVDIIKYAYGRVGLFGNALVVTGGIGVPYSYTPWAAVVENIIYVDPFIVGAKDNIIFPGFDGLKLDLNFGPANIGIMVPVSRDGVALVDEIEDLAIGAKVNLSGIGVIYLCAEDILVQNGLIFSVGFELGAVENLYAAAKFVYEAGATATMGFGVSASYSFGSFMVANDFAMDITNSAFHDDIAVYYFADTWDVYAGFAYGNEAWNTANEAENYIFVYFDYYAGKFTFNPYLTINLGDTVTFGLQLWMIYAF